MATLFCHIFHVLFVGTKKQMVGIDARRVIASVEHANAMIAVVFWYWAVMQLEGKTMSENPTIWFSKNHHSVTSGKSVSSPRPTFVWAKFINALPEIFFGREPRHKGVVVPADISHWLAFFPSLAGALMGRKFGLLSATTLTVAIGNIVRGIIGVHRELTFLVSNPGALARRCPVFLSVVTGVIISQVYFFGRYIPLPR